MSVPGCFGQQILSYIGGVNEGSVITDPELGRRIAGGSEDAFKQLFDTYRPRLLAYLLKLIDTPELAEDMVQEIFMRIWASRKLLQDVDNLNAYIYSIARNIAYNGFKLHAKEQLLLTELKRQEVGTSYHHEHELVAKEVRQQIDRIIDNLTPMQRQVFKLSREGGLKHEEIAAQLGMSVLTVRKHIARSLKILRAEIGRDYGAQAVILFVIFGLLES